MFQSIVHNILINAHSSPGRQRRQKKNNKDDSGFAENVDYLGSTVTVLCMTEL